MKAIKLLYVLVSRFSYLLWNSQPRERKFVATLMFWVTELVKEANFKDTITLWDLQVREINNFSLHKNFCQNERAGQGQLGFPRCLSDKVTRHVLPNPCKCPVKPTGWAHSISWSVNPSPREDPKGNHQERCGENSGALSCPETPSEKWNREAPCLHWNKTEAESQQRALNSSAGQFTTASSRTVNLAFKIQIWGAVHQEEEMKTETLHAPEV